MKYSVSPPPRRPSASASCTRYASSFVTTRSARTRVAPTCRSGAGVARSPSAIAPVVAGLVGVHAQPHARAGRRVDIAAVLLVARRQAGERRILVVRVDPFDLRRDQRRDREACATSAARRRPGRRRCDRRTRRGAEAAAVGRHRQLAPLAARGNDQRRRRRASATRPRSANDRANLQRLSERHARVAGRHLDLDRSAGPMRARRVSPAADEQRRAEPPTRQGQRDDPGGGRQHGAPERRGRHDRSTASSRAASRPRPREQRAANGTRWPADRGVQRRPPSRAHRRASRAPDRAPPVPR